MRKYFFYVLFIANLAAVSYFWWTGGSGELWRLGSDGVLIAFGRLAGLLGQLFILVQLTLIGRIGPLEQAFGMDKLTRPHRWIGYGLLGLFILHPLLLTLGHAGANEVSATKQFLDFFGWEDVFNAFLALMIFVAVILASLPPIRRRLRYEHWYAFHLLIYVAIILVFGHETKSGDLIAGSSLYYWFILNFFVFGVFLSYRFLRPLWLFNRHRFRVERVIQETEDVSSVYITGRELKRFAWRAGQFANVYFLQRGFWWGHPFSFSWAPTSEGIRFSIKAFGDFTGRIPQLRPGTPVGIDGPLGIFTAREAKQDKFLLIAGGIGITPVRALAEELTKKDMDVVLIYAAKTEADFVLRGELERFSRLHAHYLTGLLSFEKIESLVVDYREREIYVCGPWAMMDHLIKHFMAAGVPREQLHFERFQY
jgi:predicted ferric reductase